MIHRRLYNAVAIALALGLWVIRGLASHRVRAHVSPHRGSPSEREHGWRSVGRWVRGAEKLWPRLRLEAGAGQRRALEVVQQLAARALAASGSIIELGCEGALRT